MIHVTVLVKAHKTKIIFYFLLKNVCLKVSISSAKTNILLNCAITAKVKLIFLPCKEIPDYFLGRI